MDWLQHLATGFGVAFTAQNLLYCFIGCLLGTLIGVLPGIGPVATIAMLLPATYALPRWRRSSCWRASTTVRSTAASTIGHPGQPAG
ncbi:MAG: tripartite tricarboxylate transporter permease [Paenacidovorax caeni]